MIAVALVISAFLITPVCAEMAVSPTVVVTDECVTIAAGDQALSVRLADAGLDLKTPYQSYHFSPGLMQGEGWVRPTRPASEPRIERRRGGVHVEIRYPVAGDRAFTIEADAYDGIPAVFVTSRLEVTRSTRAEYYYWGWRGTFGHYFTSGPSGPERREITDTSKFTRLGYQNWFFLPSESGGLALFSKGDVGRGGGDKGEPFLWAIIRGRALGIGESMIAGFGIAGVKDQQEAHRLWKLIEKRGIPALRRTPDLKPLARLDYGKPAPEWLRNAEIYNGFYHARPAWNRANIRMMSRVGLIVGVPHDKLIIDMCHRAGFRVIPYVNYMELLHTEIEAKARGKVYYEWTQQADNEKLDLVNHPDWIARDSEGREVKSIWGSNNGHPGLFYTCFHQQSLREAALEQVRKLMHMGADGVFIDNAGPVTECAGDKSGKHQHSDPLSTNTDMYEELQRSIYGLVKSFGEDRIVMHNSSVIASHWPYCDAQMWESCIYGAGTKERMDEWEELRYRGEELAEAVRHGKAPVILSYIDSQPAERRADCALYSYAYARLYGILWADWFGLIKPNQPVNEAAGLYDVRMGKPKGDARQQGSVFCREFERGMVLLNPSKTAEDVTVPAPRGARVDDIGRGVILTPSKGAFRVRVMPESAHVLCWRP